MAHRTAAQRRETRRRKRKHRHDPQGDHASDGWDLRFLPGPPVGPGVRTSSPEDIAGALARLPGDLGWEHVASRVLPQFQRARPYPAGLPTPIVTVVPPGLPVSLGIDIGPAHIHVTSELLERWSLSVTDVTARALVNLHERASGVTSGQIVWGDIDGVRTGWLQTERGIGSTLVLAPHELARILGDAPRSLITPMRDLLIALPPQEIELAAWLFAEIASEDPNHLQPRVFQFDGRSVMVCAVDARGYR